MTDDQPHVLVVDDEEANRDLFVRLFDEDFSLLVASSADEALTELAQHEVGVLLSDHRMPGMTGVDLLAIAAEKWPDMRRVLVTAYSDRELLLDAIRRGHVQEYVTKPWEVDDLRLRIEAGLAAFVRARDLGRASKERAALRAEIDERAGASDAIVGLDGGLAAIKSTIEKLAASHAPVVIQGELGTGKELVARAIHKRSARADGPFIRVACRATARANERSGAWPGSGSEQAHGGTLFLDEVAALADDAQAGLLETIDDPRVRVIAATCVSLDERVKQGTFREDLFFRLNVVPIRIPSLRERAQDIGALANHFASVIGRAMGKEVAISSDAIAGLRAYDWPGNVRELKNVIERACVLADSNTTLERDDLLFDFNLSSSNVSDAGVSLGSATAEPAVASIFDEISSEEAQRIRDALRQAAGNRARASRLLGIPRTTLNDRIKRLGLA